MIIPVILEPSFEEIQNKIKRVEKLVKNVAIDIADGKLVDGITFLDIKKLDEIQTTLTFELDFMVENPLFYLDKKLEKVDKVCINMAALNSVPHFILKAKELGYKTGVSVNPTTQVDLLDPLIDHIDFVQFMGVLPGGQQRVFEEPVIEVIRSFKQIHSNVEIQVDGGLNEDTLPKFKGLGVKNYIIGSALFGSENIEQTYHTLNNIISNL